MHFIKEISLKSGPLGTSGPLKFQPASVNLFVGPNNSGKSLLLREIAQFVSSGQMKPGILVLSTCHFGIPDEPSKALIKQKLLQQPSRGQFLPPDNVLVGRRQNRNAIQKSQFEIWLNDFNAHPHACSHIVRHLLLSLDGSNRLSLLNEQERGDLLQPPQNLLASLFVDDSKRQEVRRIIYDAFGRYFVIDPTPSRNLRVRLSDKEPSLHLERSFDDEALAFHSEAEPIAQTSDGVRAFSGMVAAVVEGDPKIILLDEPEAFLHPALSNKLAKALCENARQNQQQLFVATHSASFLMGCIQAGIDLNIIRLTYRDGEATSRLLHSAKIVPLMRDPLLRSTGVLEGLFDESVIVTEGDHDRSFYDEINHRLVRSNSSLGISNCLFLNAQNWQTIGRIIRPLRELGVAAAAVVDLDVVKTSDSTGFQALLEAAGMPNGTRIALGQLRGTLRSRISRSEADVKKIGMNALRGTDREDLENLANQLAEYGVFMVPVGELELWLPKLARCSWQTKSEWLIKTFEAMGEDPTDANYLKPAADDVWAFIGKVRLWLHNPKRLGIPQ